MFEIKIKINGADGKDHFIGDCDDVRCLTQKGKRRFVCQNCPIAIMERKHDEELGNARARVNNVIYVQRNIHLGLLRNISNEDEKQLYQYMHRIFDEKPIKGLH